MLSKYFALFAAFATFTPAFAAPVPESLVDVVAGKSHLMYAFPFFIVFSF